MINDFLALSLILTSEPNLDAAVAEEYMKRIADGPLGAKLPDLLNTFSQIASQGGDIVEGVKTLIFGDAALGPLARQITILWFTAQIFTDGKGAFETPEQYFSALVWPAISAHPPGLSGGYFGHWRYRPDN